MYGSQKTGDSCAFREGVCMHGWVGGRCVQLYCPVLKSATPVTAVPVWLAKPETQAYHLPLYKHAYTTMHGLWTEPQ